MPNLTLEESIARTRNAFYEINASVDKIFTVLTGGGMPDEGEDKESAGLCNRADRMADVAEQTVNRVNGILALIERDRSADKIADSEDTYISDYMGMVKKVATTAFNPIKYMQSEQSRAAILADAKETGDAEYIAHVEELVKRSRQQ
jgi:hypothetical protein